MIRGVVGLVKGSQVHKVPFCDGIAAAVGVGMGFAGVMVFRYSGGDGRCCDLTVPQRQRPERDPGFIEGRLSPVPEDIDVSAGVFPVEQGNGAFVHEVRLGMSLREVIAQLFQCGVCVVHLVEGGVGIDACAALLGGDDLQPSVAVQIGDGVAHPVIGVVEVYGPLLHAVGDEPQLGILSVLRPDDILAAGREELPEIIAAAGILVIRAVNKDDRAGILRMAQGVYRTVGAGEIQGGGKGAVCAAGKSLGLGEQCFQLIQDTKLRDTNGSAVYPKLCLCQIQLGTQRQRLRQLFRHHQTDNAGPAGGFIPVCGGNIVSVGGDLEGEVVVTRLQPVEESKAVIILVVLDLPPLTVVEGIAAGAIDLAGEVNAEITIKHDGRNGVMQFGQQLCVQRHGVCGEKLTILKTCGVGYPSVRRCFCAVGGDLHGKLCLIPVGCGLIAQRNYRVPAVLRPGQHQIGAGDGGGIDGMDAVGIVPVDADGGFQHLVGGCGDMEPDLAARALHDARQGVVFCGAGVPVERGGSSGGELLLLCRIRVTAVSFKRQQWLRTVGTDLPAFRQIKGKAESGIAAAEIRFVLPENIAFL